MQTVLDYAYSTHQLWRCILNIDANKIDSTWRPTLSLMSNENCLSKVSTVNRGNVDYIFEYFLKILMKNENFAGFIIF